jgi:hypothetical protein
MTKLKTKYDYDNAPSKAIEAICNGCGPAGAGWKSKVIPNTIYGLSVKEACKIHDWMYYFGESDYGKELADKVFLENMYTLIADGSWWLRFLRRRRALKYYLAVKYFGKKAYMSNKESVNNNIEVKDYELKLLIIK